jgi:competence protein ComEA
MKPFQVFQERFGFTRNEIAVLLFLCVTFLVGAGVRWYRHQASTSAAVSPLEYREEDSAFIARARALLADTSGPGRTSRATSRRAAPPSLQDGSVDVNTATLEQLVSLPGIGEEIARRIIEYRGENGPFESVKELLEVKGIGPKKLERMRRFIVVQSPSSLP